MISLTPNFGILLLTVWSFFLYRSYFVIIRIEELVSRLSRYEIWQRYGNAELTKRTTIRTSCSYLVKLPIEYTYDVPGKEAPSNCFATLTPHPTRLRHHVVYIRILLFLVGSKYFKIFIYAFHGLEVCLVF